MSMTHEEMIAVIEHHKNGGKVEARNRDLPTWSVVAHPSWNFDDCEFRVKPEPLVLWAIHHGKDMIVCSDNESYVNREFEKTKELKGYTLKKFVEATK